MTPNWLKNYTQISQLLISSTVIISLSLACARQPERPMSRQAAEVIQSAQAELKGDSIEDAMVLEQKAQFLDAAKLYSKLSNDSLTPKREELHLHAVNALIQANLPTQAELLLNKLPEEKVPAALKNQYAFIRAKFAILQRSAEQGKVWIAQVDLPANAPAQQTTDFYRTRVKIWEMSGENENAIQDRMILSNVLKEKADKLKNQQAMLLTLNVLEASSLDIMLNKSRSPTLRGWIELAKLSQNNRNPARFNHALGKWQQKYPQHPVLPELLTQLVPAEKTNAAPPDLSKIALLLPLDGQLTKVSEAIRDGFLAAYYQQESNGARPSVRIYNSGPTANHALEAYDQAVEDGATIIVGPLSKEAVDMLAKNREMAVPTLTLNHLTDDNFYTDNLFQFSLSPEDEARQVAEKAWNDGRNRCIMLIPDNSWGARVAEAFRKRWEELGGELIAEQSYPAKKNDFSGPIKTALGIDDSNKRYRELSGMLRMNLNHEARRRQDVDMIFMAAYPRQARLIPPQLKFYHASDIPVYATSHAFSGKFDRGKDRDMNGVIIGDMPWSLKKRQEAPPMKRVIFKTWPNTAQRMGRLYAMGVDAYNTLYYLNWLRINPAARLSGVTGNLYMNMNNRIYRQLVWGKFSRGVPDLLPNTSFVHVN